MNKEQWEQDWWGTCQNTYGEEEKQLVYARKMGLTFFHNGKSPYNIDMQGKSVLDIGGGPCSLLLKCVNVDDAKVVDPTKFPDWVYKRYDDAGIEYEIQSGEDFPSSMTEWWDECWIYNVLQHTRSPMEVIANAKRQAKLIRIFEWIDTPTNIGHPHTLTEEQLNQWLGGEGKVEILSESGCTGKAYYGVFPT